MILSDTQWMPIIVDRPVWAPRALPHQSRSIAYRMPHEKKNCSWHFTCNMIGIQFVYVIFSHYSNSTKTFLIWSKYKQYDVYQILLLISDSISVFRKLSPWDSTIIRCYPGNNKAIVFKAVSQHHSPFIFYFLYIKKNISTFHMITYSRELTTRTIDIFIAWPPTHLWNIKLG